MSNLSAPGAQDGHSRAEPEARQRMLGGDQTWPPTRAEGLARLAAFAPRAGRDYGGKRNADLGAAGHPHVSRLSPYVRHRLVTEAEVIEAVLARHSLRGAEKFVQEVFWRTYWKGWLEMRPGVWDQYRDGLRHALDRVATEGGLRRDWEAACRGETGIDCFDHWARELSATGYLHNHARMWFASIWMFTLRLPWELGADLFLRQLLDGDPASNTLGWRWVAGIQTPGKTYLARASNIARYTEGRFNPEGQLAAEAPPLRAPPPPDRIAAPRGDRLEDGRVTGWLITEEDLLAGFDLLPREAVPACAMACADRRSRLATAPSVLAFTDGAVADMAERFAARFDGVAQARGDDRVAQVVAWACDRGLEQVAMAHAPVGPAADTVNALALRLDAEGIRLVRVLRAHDATAWPHATHGFFRFKDRIPHLVGTLKGLRTA